MVKADLTRDYYGDLELPQNADINDIKRQFKKLALLYHPDRNPGRENEVTARFQRIQSAHEVLTDSQERAKYDSNRIRSNNIYRTGGNQRGNPWSNVSSQYPTPPKPPTARARPAQPPPPPPSAGAQRYKNFEAPKQSANQTAQEGAEARRSTYEAWERMRERAPQYGQAPTGNKPAASPRKMPKAGQDKTKSFKHPQPPRSRHEFNEPDPVHASPQTSPLRRSHSQNSSHRKGFTPNTPGGDEPAAPKGAYYTHRDKPAHAPPPSDTQAPTQEQPAVDPLRHFKVKPSVQFESRQSTPYATRGGEKFNPFETININRSKSTRLPSNRYSSGGMPRVGSDSNLNSANRPRPQEPGFPRPNSTYTAPDSDDSSSDDSPQLRKGATPQASTYTGTRTFAKARSFTSTRTKTGQFTAPSMDGQQMPDGPSQAHNAYNSTGEHPTGSHQSNPQKTGDPSIFTFNVDDNTFQRTDANGFKATSTESVNTTFSPEEWHAQFESGHFAPEQGAGGIPRHPRTQSGSRTRGRSPPKSRPGEKKPMQARAEPESSAESSPGGTKFSQDEWAGTFKPQSFMPPPPPMNKTPILQRPARRSRVPSIRPTMGTAAVVDDGDTSDDKPLFQGRKPSISHAAPTPPSPDAMDLDTPASSSTPIPNANEEAKSYVKSAKSTPPSTQPPTETESLKVNFEDLKIQDLISTIDLPVPPTAPQIPTAHIPRTKDTLDAYLEKFKVYMTDWDLFSTRMMLHLVARKQQNDKLGATRWLNVEGISSYRKGLQEDSAVLQWWTGAMDMHEENMKQCQVLEGRTAHD